MRTAYNDTFIRDDQDPVDGQVADFDWEAVYERLDGREGSADRSPEDTETIMELLKLLLTEAQGQQINPKTLGLRLLALGWVVDPANYPGGPSLRELAERCGVSPAALAFHTGAISRSTGIRNRAQRHASNWKPPERSALGDGSLLEDPKVNDPA